MRHATHLLAGALVGALALASAGCGGGGGGTSGTQSTTTPPAAQQQADQVVVAYDFNNDSALDVLTLDPTTTPMRIVSVLEGTAAGGFTDQSAARSGQPIDAKVSDAVAGYLVDADSVGSGTEIDVVDASGRDVTVTVYE
jgi:hypothetical protein